MHPRYLQDLIKNLQEYYKCPSCETNYHFDDIRFLGEIDSYCFVQLSCHDCSMPVLATVTLGEQPGTKKAGTDMHHHEVAKFATRGAITSGEIAEFHRWITKSRLVFKRSK
jgi:hypothetical protein